MKDYKNNYYYIKSGGGINVQSDWLESDNTKDSFIKNKPTIPTDIDDLTDTNSLLGDKNIQSDWSENNSGSDGFIKNKPTLFSGDYVDLINKPTDLSDFNDDLDFKTINQQSIRGVGDIEIQGDDSYKVDLQSETTNVTLSVTNHYRKYFYYNTTTNSTITIPTNASQAFAIGTVINGYTRNETTFSDSGITLYTDANSNKQVEKNSGFTLIKTDTDTWLLMGKFKL